MPLYGPLISTGSTPINMRNPSSQVTSFIGDLQFLRHPVHRSLQQVPLFHWRKYEKKHQLLKKYTSSKAIQLKRQQSQQSSNVPLVVRRLPTRSCPRCLTRTWKNQPLSAKLWMRANQCPTRRQSPSINALLIQKQANKIPHLQSIKRSVPGFTQTRLHYSNDSRCIPYSQGATVAAVTHFFARRRKAFFPNVYGRNL